MDGIATMLLYRLFARSSVWKRFAPKSPLFVILFSCLKKIALHGPRRKV